MTEIDSTLSRIQVDRAESAQAPALAMLAAETFRAAYEAILPAADLARYEREAFGTDRVRAEIDDPAIRLCVARCNQALCGYSRMEATPVPAEIDSAHAIELVRLYVAAPWQGRGVGRALLEDALGHAQGFDACWLRVWVGNEPAIGFYRAYGFEVVGRGPYSVGNSVRTVLIMRRRGEVPSAGLARG
jgi:ribosomal protein S18 acetylase RimI-like enzyme